MVRKDDDGDGEVGGGWEGGVGCGVGTGTGLGSGTDTIGVDGPAGYVAAGATGDADISLQPAAITASSRIQRILIENNAECPLSPEVSVEIQSSS
jgi:hypothetical protein